jgi:uncharacterized protein
MSVNEPLADPSIDPSSDPSIHATATLAQIVVYPIKSCGGVSLDACEVLPTGLDLDRAWALVDAAGRFISQRDWPRMALISPQLKTFEMVLRAPGMLALHVQIDAVESPVQAQVWDDWVSAFDMGDVAARWLSMFLSEGRVPMRLVRFDPDFVRRCSPKWTGQTEASTQFADGFPLLVTTDCAIDGLNQRLAAGGHSPVTLSRFRPNLVLSGLPEHDEDNILELVLGAGVVLRLVKPCVRCSVPNVDPATGLEHPAVSQALAQYRSDARMEGALTWGMNAIMAAGASQLLRVGATVGVRYAL